MKDNSRRYFIASLLGAVAAPMGGVFVFGRASQESSGSDGSNAVDSLPRRSIRSFGAAGDGTADDAAAIEAAVLSGYPLDWEDGTYRVSRQIGSGQRIRRMDWQASDARVVLDQVSEHQPALIRFDVAAAVDHKLTGTGLTFDGSGRVNRCVSIYQRDARQTGTLHLEGLFGVNARRDPRFPGGDGVRIHGGFKWVRAVRCGARNIVLPRGAGTPTRVGVAGFSVVRMSGGKWPLFIHIIDPQIENIYSEDPSYYMDQDGLQLFGQPDHPSRGFDHCRVEGGTFRNCNGRDIKVQMGGGAVTGGTFIHDRPNGRGAINASIDFQTGPGTVSQVHHIFDGVGVARAVVLNSSGVHNRFMPGLYSDSTLTSQNMSRANGIVIPALLSNEPRDQANPADTSYPHLEIRNVRCSGPVERAVIARTPGDRMVVVATAITADFGSALVEVQPRNGTAPYGASINARECHNFGKAVPIVKLDRSASALSAVLDALNCTGFINQSNGPV